jgi:putative protease
LPRITKDLYLKFVLPILPRAEVDAVMVDGVGAALAASETAPRLPIYGSSGLNVWNHRTVKRLSSIFQLLTLSPELSMHELSWLTARSAKDVNLELVVQGNQEVMVTQDCLLRLIKEKAAFWGLQDFRRVFPIHVDDASRTYIFNAVETCLVDHLPEILQMGLDGVAIDARHRTERYAEEMTRIYVDAIEIASKTDEAPDDQLNALKERARLISLGGITTGHFLKGLKETLE